MVRGGRGEHGRGRQQVLSMQRHGRDFVGMLAVPADVEPQQSWLFLNPFGQEAIRTAPMYRSLADRLVRAGCAVLRFDYHGAGDSAGEPADQSLDDWVGDSRCAIEHLRAVGAAPGITLFGVGLGATIAALAAAEETAGIGTLLLWEPVINGPQYLEALVSSHRREVARGFDMSWSAVRAAFDEPEPVAPGNLVGFDVGPRLAAQIGSTTSLPLIELANRGVRTLIASREAGARPAVSHALVQSIMIEISTDWMANETMGSALVPPQLIALIDQLASSP